MAGSALPAGPLELKHQRPCPARAQSAARRSRRSLLLSRRHQCSGCTPIPRTRCMQLAARAQLHAGQLRMQLPPAETVATQRPPAWWHWQPAQGPEWRTTWFFFVGESSAQLHACCGAWQAPEQAREPAGIIAFLAGCTGALFRPVLEDLARRRCALSTGFAVLGLLSAG